MFVLSYDSFNMWIKTCKITKHCLSYMWLLNVWDLLNINFKNRKLEKLLRWWSVFISALSHHQMSFTICSEVSRQHYNMLFGDHCNSDFQFYNKDMKVRTDFPEIYFLKTWKDTCHFIYMVYFSLMTFQWKVTAFGFLFFFWLRNCRF